MKQGRIFLLFLITESTTTAIVDVSQVVQDILNAKMMDKLIRNNVLILSSIEDYTVCLQYLHKGRFCFLSLLIDVLVPGCYSNHVTSLFDMQELLSMTQSFC